MTSKPYDSKILTAIAEELLYDYELSLEQITNLAADLPGECDAICEDAWQRQQETLMESGGPDNSGYRRDMIAAGRSHLLGE